MERLHYFLSHHSYMFYLKSLKILLFLLSLKWITLFLFSITFCKYFFAFSSFYFNTHVLPKIILSQTSAFSCEERTLLFLLSEAGALEWKFEPFMRGNFPVLIFLSVSDVKPLLSNYFLIEKFTFLVVCGSFFME